MALRERSNALGILNGENANARLNGKMVTRATSKSVKSTLGTRGALENISNVSRNNLQAAGKKELKPKRGMVKSKATTSLQSVIGLNVEPVVKAKVQSPEPMDMSEMSNALEAYSENLLHGVEDIDKEDHHNPQLCSELVNDIYKYMRELERRYKVRSDYLSMQPIVNERMRTILVDWLVQVHLKFRLLQETLFLTVQIVDRYLEVQTVSKEALQLVGVTAMLVASKYEEMYPPEIGDFVYITDNAYSKAQIRTMECNILRKLDFNLGKPLCLHFLRRNSKAGVVEEEQHTLAKYLMELTLQEYSFVECDPSEIAAAALCLSNKILKPDKEWTATLVHYSTYSEDYLTPIMKNMAIVLENVPTSKYQAVRKKYAGSKFKGISVTEKLKSPVISELANANHDY